MTLTEFLLARISDDEAVARAAIDPDRPGTHWEWARYEDDVTLMSSDLGDGRVYLRSVEEFTTSPGGGNLPAFVLSYVEPDESRSLPHIARHDPARVLSECEAKRRIVEYATNQHTGGIEFDPILEMLASTNADHAEFQDAWRNDTL